MSDSAELETIIGSEVDDAHSPKLTLGKKVLVKFLSTDESDFFRMEGQVVGINPITGTIRIRPTRELSRGNQCDVDLSRVLVIPKKDQSKYTFYPLRK
jgi:hypothetical protein